MWERLSTEELIAAATAGGNRSIYGNLLKLSSESGDSSYGGLNYGSVFGSDGALWSQRQLKFAFPKKPAELIWGSRHKIAASIAAEPVVAAFVMPKPVVIPKSLASLLAAVRAHAPAV